jgi:hypothetical protein
MMYVQCPHCFEDKPLGARHCPKCTQRVTNSQTAAGEFWGLFWMIVIGAIIWNLIT